MSSTPLAEKLKNSLSRDKEKLVLIKALDPLPGIECDPYVVYPLVYDMSDEEVTLALEVNKMYGPRYLVHVILKS